MLSSRIAWTLVVALSPSVSAAARAQHPELSVASALTPDAKYVFSVDACQTEDDSTSCEAFVRLVRAGAVLATQSLGQHSAADPARVDAEEVQGIGDPLGDASGWLAWRTGREQDQVTIAARLVRLAPEREGLVLHTELWGGRRDSLVVRTGDALSWSQLDGNWTSVAVVPEGDVDTLFLFEGRKMERGFRWVSEARWNDATSAIELKLGRDPRAYLAVIGPYANAEAADADEDCLPGGMRVSTMPYFGMPKGPFVLAGITADRHLGESALADATCPADKRRSLVPLRFRQLSRGEYALGEGAVASLSVGRFHGEGWPLFVHVRSSDGAQQRLAVSWPANMPFLVPTSKMEGRRADVVKPFLGAGWTVGDGYEHHETLAVQRVHAGGERYALLFSMRAGFEHVKHRHDLVVVRDGKLRLAWSQEDPSGPSISMVDVRPGAQGWDEVLRLEWFYGADYGELDEVTITRVSYDPGSSKWKPAALGCDSGVHVLVYQRFASRAAAMAARAKPCKGEVSDSYRGLGAMVMRAARVVGGSGFVLAEVFLSQDELEKASARALACRPELQPEPTTWCPTKRP